MRSPTTGRAGRPAGSSRAPNSRSTDVPSAAASRIAASAAGMCRPRSTAPTRARLTRASRASSAWVRPAAVRAARIRPAMSSAEPMLGSYATDRILAPRAARYAHGVRIVLLCVLIAGALASEAQAATGFRSPSGNIGCYIGQNLARCDIRERDWSPPPKPASCQLDWGQGVAVDRRDRKASFVCAGDTALNDGRKLGYGDSIRRGDLRCRSRRSGMHCRNLRTDHGFALSRDSARLF